MDERTLTQYCAYTSQGKFRRFHLAPTTATATSQNVNTFGLDYLKVFQYFRLIRTLKLPVEPYFQMSATDRNYTFDAPHPTDHAGKCPPNPV